MPSIKVLLREDDLKALADRAVREYRTPSDQAAFMIADGLRRAVGRPFPPTDAQRQRDLSQSDATP